jgi:hypothetical protein
MLDRLSLNCGMHDVIVNDCIGYHLLDWITVECRDDFSEELFTNRLGYHTVGLIPGS